MTRGAPDTPITSWAVAAVVVGAAIAGLIAWLLATTGDPAPTSHAPASPTPGGDPHADNGDGCRWASETLIVGGVTVPASCRHGPREVDENRLAGWAHTRTGAAHAAAGLGVTTTALVGPDAYRATIRQQTYGPASERRVLLADVAGQYAELDRQHQLDGGAFKGTWERLRIEGYRVADYTPNQATVWLWTPSLDAQGHERDVAQRLDLRWIDGDWQASVTTLRRAQQHLNRHPVTERFTRFRQ